MRWRPWAKIVPFLGRGIPATSLYFDFLSGALDSRITFTRASAGYRVNASGLLESMSTDVPRFDYDPSTTRTNLALYSEDFTNAAWTKNRSTIGSNSWVAPDGATTGDTIIEDNTAANTHGATCSLSATNGVSYTLSVFAKKKERHLVLALESGAGLNHYAAFNLDTGVVGGTFGSPTTSIAALPNGVYRCSITAAATSTASASASIYAASAATVGGRIYTGDNASGVYAWGAQLEAGAVATDYIKTTSAAVTVAAPRGLLIEEARTNTCLYSEELDNVAAWGVTRATITANATTAPDGTATADKICEDTSNNSHRSIQSFTGTAATWTGSVFFKSAERTAVEIRLFDGTNEYGAIYNLATGVVAAIQGDVSASGIVAYPNGWYRCWVARPLLVSTCSMSLYLHSPAGVRTYQGVTGEGLYAWGAQLEAGAFPTSYIKTAGASATRAADVATVGTLTPWFNAVEGTVFAEFTPRGVVTTAISNPAYQFSDGTINNTITAVSTPSNTFNTQVADGNVVQANISHGAIVAGATYKSARAYKANDFSGALNGVLATPDTAGTVPALSQLNVGARLHSGSAYLNGHLRRVSYWPQRLPNATLQALTA